jgi:hypothetical protein
MSRELRVMDVHRVVIEYFKHSGRDRMFIWDYEFSVRSGWDYEGIQIYAYDCEHNYYFKQHIPAETIDDFKRGRKNFGETVGVAITELRDNITDHEVNYSRGYW